MSAAHLAVERALVGSVPTSVTAPQRSRRRAQRAWCTVTRGARAWRGGAAAAPPWRARRSAHADERDRVAQVEYACAHERCILTEVVPRENREGDAPRGPHGGERGLQREEPEYGGVFQADEAHVREACVGGGGEGGGEAVEDMSGSRGGPPWAEKRNARAQCAGVGNGEGGIVQLPREVRGGVTVMTAKNGCGCGVRWPRMRCRRAACSQSE